MAVTSRFAASASSTTASTSATECCVSDPVGRNATPPLAMILMWVGALAEPSRAASRTPVTPVRDTADPGPSGWSSWATPSPRAGVPVAAGLGERLAAEEAFGPLTSPPLGLVDPLVGAAHVATVVNPRRSIAAMIRAVPNAT